MTDSKVDAKVLMEGLKEMESSFIALGKKHGMELVGVASHWAHFKLIVAVGAKAATTNDLDNFIAAVMRHEQHFISMLAEFMDLDREQIDKLAAGFEDQARRIGADMSEKAGGMPILVTPIHAVKFKGEKPDGR